MPLFQLKAIVISRRSLVRELLSELLRTRCGAHVLAQYAGPEQFPIDLPTVQVVVCDMADQPLATVEAALARALAMPVPPHLIRIDAAGAAFSAEEFVRAVRETASTAGNPGERLTPLEIEVMVAIATGLRNADVARQMRRSFKTVEKHRANLLRKLGLKSVAQLTAYAIRNGYLSVDAILAAKKG